MEQNNYDQMDYEIINKYDENGNLVVHTTSKGEYKEYRYDKRSNLIYYNSNFGVEEIFKKYDDKDRVVNIRTSSGTLTKIEYTDDDEGRILRKVSTIIDLDTKISHTVSENYEYFADGSYRITYFSDLKEYKIETYDARGNITLEDSKKFTRIFLYDENGRKIKEINSLGIEEQWEYNTDGNIKSHKVLRNGKEKLKIEYEYGENGNLLFEHNSNNAYIKYKYDKNGNCIEKDSNTKYNSAIMKYDNRNRKILTVCDNLTETFEYDENNHLIRYVRYRTPTGTGNTRVDTEWFNEKE